MKVSRWIIMLCCVVFLLAGCSLGEDKDSDRSSAARRSTDKELYKMGLELISVMDEMLNDETYLELMGSSRYMEDALEKANTRDYDYPVAVYAISMPEITVLLEEVYGFDRETWDSMSSNLRTQVENRFSFAMLASQINGLRGTDEIAFSTICTAVDYNKKLNVKEDITFLYIFEEGIPIAVSFSERGSIQGQFLFLEDVETLSDVREAFEDVGCSVKKVDIDKF